MTRRRIKVNGVHYTPGDLARFLAEVTARQLDGLPRSLQVLDPACGDGALLEAFALTLPEPQRHQVRLVGYEKDPKATDQARQRLGAITSNLQLTTRDFLELDGIDGQPHEGGRGPELQPFDVVIANPPYVRTQVMGRHAAQALARRFGLTGRVDLSHAFAVAIANSLKPGGVLGLLTSNRFLTIKSGQSLRALFRTEFDIREVYDLGDTKLFTAAVLPAIVVATKHSESPDLDSRVAKSAPMFVRVYECQASQSNVTTGPQLLDALRQPTLSGIVQANDRNYHVQRGTLSQTTASQTTGATDVWILNTPELAEWLSAVSTTSSCRIGDIAAVRVGIKTTADKVFVREDWESLDREERPEKQLLLPLLTHHEAARWGVWRGPHGESFTHT